MRRGAGLQGPGSGGEECFCGGPVYDDGGACAHMCRDLPLVQQQGTWTGGCVSLRWAKPPPGPSPGSLPTFPFLSPALDMGAPLISSVPASAPQSFGGFSSPQSPAQTTLLISQHYLLSAWCPITCFSPFTLNTPKLSPLPMLFPPCSVPCSRGSWWHGCHSSLSNPRSCCLFFPSSPQSCLFLPSPMGPRLLFWGTVTSALAASLPYPT